MILIFGVLAIMKRVSKVIKNSKKPTQKALSWVIATTSYFALMILFYTPINSSGFGGSQHNGITQDALPFLRNEILSWVISGNLHEDTFPASVAI